MTNLPIPNDTQLLAGAVLGQWLSLDRPANRLGFAFSDGIAIKILR